MDIVCPECGKCHGVAEDKLPDLKFNAICRDCGVKFAVECNTCPSCGTKNQKGQPCPCRAEARQESPEGSKSDEGSVVPAHSPDEFQRGEQGPQEPRQGRQGNEVREEHPLHFAGSGQEFFRIWIVNLFLTIITLGIYNAWEIGRAHV